MEHHPCRSPFLIHYIFISHSNRHHFRRFKVQVGIVTTKFEILKSSVKPHFCGIFHQIHPISSKFIQILYIYDICGVDVPRHFFHPLVQTGGFLSARRVCEAHRSSSWMEIYGFVSKCREKQQNFQGLQDKRLMGHFKTAEFRGRWPKVCESMIQIQALILYDLQSSPY